MLWLTETNLIQLLQKWMNSSADHTQIISSPVKFPVVGIGASIGGLDAVKLFLGSLPAKSGMAYIFVQHISPNHKSILPHLLESISPVPVVQITDHIILEQDILYIIPENKVVTAIDGMLTLQPLNKKLKIKDTIDIFFSSLGIVHQSHAVGIILSGALNDGTVGLQVIKSHGGLTFAQDGESAAHNSMPNSAVKAGVIDFVLAPGMIAERLIAINSPFQSDYITGAQALTAQEENDVFKQILTVLRARRGVDFQYYKSSTLKRRILRRMALSKFEKPADYLYHLRESKLEQDALYNDMLISVTSFYRDPASFLALCNEIFPQLIKNQSPDMASIRIWVAGCATGEEAYSMAICLEEYLGNQIGAVKVQIFATDISETAIAKARLGIYRPQEMGGLSQARIERFFTKTERGYQVNKTIRDFCVFAHHNFLKDPPFSKIDLLSCRNVMIYLEPVLQKRALNTFHYALNENGYLMLGRSETVGSATEMFSPYNNADKLFARKGPAGKHRNVTSFVKEQTFKDANYELRNAEAGKDIFKASDDALLAAFMPPAVVVNDRFDVIQFKGGTEPWLNLPLGKPSFNILKIARHGLAFELRNLLQQAKKSGTTAKKFGIFYHINELQHYANLQVVPLLHNGEQFYMVIFQTASSTGIQPSMFEVDQPEQNENFNGSDLRVEHLERELVQSRADMRVISEEQENALEKMQISNEELLSANEELQSLNEELETSKEELQSTNEEIVIVNKELTDRNVQLNNAKIYTEGIVNTIRDPLLVLDGDLKIKQASRSFYNKFGYKEAQIEGQYLYKIGQEEWAVPELRELLEAILPEKEVMDDFEFSHFISVIGKRSFLLNARQIINASGEQLILLAMEESIKYTSKKIM